MQALIISGIILLSLLGNQAEQTHAATYSKKQVLSEQISFTTSIWGNALADNEISDSFPDTGSGIENNTLQAINLAKECLELGLRKTISFQSKNLLPLCIDLPPPSIA